MNSYPDLFSIGTQGNVVMNPQFIEFNEIRNWSIERQVESFWKQMRKHIFEGG